MASSDDERVEVRARGPRRNASSSHAKFVDQVLNGESRLCLENFRMDKQVFLKLCDMLQSKDLLHHTNRIKIEEQVAIFMFIVGHNLRTRAVQERFRYSGETISRHFNKVLNAIMEISGEFFEPPNEAPPEISNSRFYPYFKDCIGVLDCTHMPVMIGVDEQGPFRNKKGLLSQQVLAACSFDLKFLYVLAGWEGSAPELRVLHAALTRQSNLQIPEGKYYLVDNKFTNLPGFITPYDGVPYTMDEYPNGYFPQHATELFNLRHSSLRSTSDRTFAALKARFPILTSAPPYPLTTQVKLVVVCCALHNFIRMEKPDDWIFRMFEREDAVPMELPAPPSENGRKMAEDLGYRSAEMDTMGQYRDAIASVMWGDYIGGFSPM